MKNLEKNQSEMLTEIFEGTNGDKKVICILDDNCVRYMILKNGKLTSRHEFNNCRKNLCFNNATKALNR